MWKWILKKKAIAGWFVSIYPEKINQLPWIFSDISWNEQAFCGSEKWINVTSIVRFMNACFHCTISKIEQKRNKMRLFCLESKLISSMKWINNEKVYPPIRNIEFVKKKQKKMKRRKIRYMIGGATIWLNNNSDRLTIYLYVFYHAINSRFLSRR